MAGLIPLHEKPVALTAELEQRHRPTILVPNIGRNGQARLAAARVLVVGCGGLGSPVISYLAAAGVGTLGLCDADHVEESNLGRQIIHSELSLDTAKTTSAAGRAHQLNSSVLVREYPKLTASNIGQIGPDYDLIVECSDNFSTKYLVADWCADSGMPLVWGTVVSVHYQVSVFWTKPPSGMPKVTLRDLYPSEPSPGQTPNSKTVGVLGAAAGVCGSLMAIEAVKLITGFGDPLLGRLLIGDASTANTTVLNFI